MIAVPGPALKAHGDVQVRSQVVGFKKIKFYTLENVGSGKINLPELELHTNAFWYAFPQSIRFHRGLEGETFGGALRGLANILGKIAVISFLCLELGARFFDLASVQGQFILVGLVVFIKELVLVGLLDAFAFEVVLSASLFFWFAASAFFTGLIAPLISSILKTVQIRTGGESKEAL